MPRERKMAGVVKSGLVAMTFLVEHGCRLITRYRTAMNEAINIAVGAGHITTTQRDQLFAWLDGLAAICSLLKLITGY